MALTEYRVWDRTQRVFHWLNFLAVLKVFYSLDKRLDTMRTAPRSIDMGGWSLAGMIGERASDLDPERGFARVKAFRGFTGAGVVVAEHERGGFDYLEFQAKYGAAYEGPESFGAVSGV